MEPRSAQVPRLSEWLLLVGGLGLLVLVVGVVAVKVVRPMIAPRGCCAPMPEAQSNLKALYTAQRAFFGEKDMYSEDMGHVGFEPALGNRYTYFAATHGYVLRAEERRTPVTPAGAPRPPYQLVAGDPEARNFRGSFSSFWQTGCPLTRATLPDGTSAGLGVTGQGDTAVFIGAAAANIDDDPTPDCWSIATVERVAADGERIAPGQPYNELNDVEH